MNVFNVYFMYKVSFVQNSTYIYDYIKNKMI